MMKLSIKIIEAMTNSTWLGCHHGIHVLRCKGCGEIHYAKFLLQRGEIVPVLVEGDGIPPEEHTGEDVLVPEAFYRAFEGE